MCFSKTSLETLEYRNIFGIDVVDENDGDGGGDGMDVCFCWNYY